MTPTTAISILFLILFTACWVMYLLEAFEQDPGQALLTLLVPFYVFYFALIKSKRSPGAAVVTVLLFMVAVNLHFLVRLA
jgi:cell division protein FtsW (lipid II flippase)